MSSQPPVGEAVNELWGADWPDVRDLWPLEATVAHLNHGSFGAVPTAVLQEQQSWRERMEANPVRFFVREEPAALDQARIEVAQFLGTDVSGLAFIRNATTAASTVLSSLGLRPGDEILLTDHAYGAVRIAAVRWAEATGAVVVTTHVPLRSDDAEATEAVLAQVSDRTRLAVLEHVTSPTARRMPVVSLVPGLHDRGVLVYVDGAHAPGMLAVDLDGLGADFWSGSLHKWGSAPRGTAVLYSTQEQRPRLRPLVASWAEAEGFPTAFNRTGTEDHTAWLAAPRGLRFLDQLGFDRLRRHNVELAVLGQQMVAEAVGVDSGALPRDPAVSMQLVPLPAGIAGDERAASALQDRIGEQIGVEVAVTTWDGQGFVRLSAQAYNSPADYARLARDLPSLL